MLMAPSMTVTVSLVELGWKSTFAEETIYVAPADAMLLRKLASEKTSRFSLSGPLPIFS